MITWHVWEGSHSLRLSHKEKKNEPKLNLSAELSGAFDSHGWDFLDLRMIFFEY